MLAASARMGAMCSPSSTQDDIHAIGRYGEAIGLMFQIVDDLLDVTQTAEHTGKRTGKDAAAGKLTYPGLLGVEGSRRRVAELLASAEAAIEGFGSRGASLSELARFMAERTR